MRVQHDLTPAEREVEKTLIEEMKDKNANEKENFFWVVKGMPGSRKTVRIEKRNREPSAAAARDQPEGVQPAV